MSNDLKSHNIERLIDEADEIVRRIKSDAIKDLQEEQRLRFEKHAQDLKKIKATVQGELENKETSEIGSGAEGMHEAIQAIVKAMRDLTKFLS